MDGSNTAVYDGMSLDDVLQHFGVKGMKWGVRRSRAQLDASTDAQTVKAHRKSIREQSSTRHLSNKELQEVITRMNLEKQYAELVRTQANTINKGHENVKNILKVIDTASKVHSTLNSPLVKDVKKFLSS